MYRGFPGVVDHRRMVCCAGDFCSSAILLCDGFWFDVYAVKRPMGRAAITCGDDLKGIGDMPQQAV